MNDQKKNIVICDIDGTVANNDHRQHLLKNFKDWDKFFSQLHLDKPIYEIIDKVKEFKKNGKEIIFMTGRPKRYQEETEKWLQRYFKFEFKIVLRDDDDLRNKLEVKEELLNKNIDVERVYCFIENDTQLSLLWNRLGFSVIEVSDK